MKWSYFFILFITFSACKKDKLLQKEKVIKKAEKPTQMDGVWYNRVQKMPVLKECYHEDLIWKDIKKCSDEKVVEIIYSNLKMPTEVGCDFSKRVIVQFTIEIDGSISNIRFPRKVESCLEGEARRLVGLLPEWRPGSLYGKDAEVQYTLPIRFDTEKNIKE